VEVIKENVRAAQMRQKRYHDEGRAFWQYEVGNYVQRFGVKGKLAPHYIGPYEITQVCGPVAYCVWLPNRFSAVHNVFHVSQLRKCVHIPETEIITEANAWIELDLSLVEHPMQILNRNEIKTQRHTVKTYKI
jgi:hypothetical protein